ncbi:hypothetical protein DE146DRAFT_727259 [Phaeosphaeria sp. MPI-PUGE-AT-0046c]|nr:hypothetical protein DE146DRAFT_727259 [Phaeosphaeria sp. MPI-PUGE-AT-0046c]
MPHKHKRRADNDDANQYALHTPPLTHDLLFATSLPVGKARTFSSAPKAKKRKTGHVEGYGADDTPKAFARLLAFTQSKQPRRNGLDDGVVKSKKQKRQEQQQQQEQKDNAKTISADAEKDTSGVVAKASTAEKEKPDLRIQPGESLSDFRARVDAALPLSGISRSGRKVAGVSDHRVTKHERKLKRLQKGWREEEARIRDKEAEERELAEEEEDEDKAMWEDKTADLASTTTTNGKKKKKAKKGKRKLVAGEVDNHSEDEWEALKKKRESAGGRKGLHDVVSAPPEFTKTPREIFKVKNGAGAKVGNVPNSVGSLRKREEVAEERKAIIDTYRELMARKRGE